LAAKIHPKTPYFLQGLEISKENPGHCFDLNGSRAGRIPNSRGSTSTLEVRQEEKFRWTQVRSAFLKKHKGGKNDSTKEHEILSRKAARLHMDPCRARHERHS